MDVGSASSYHVAALLVASAEKTELFFPVDTFVMRYGLEFLEKSSRVNGVVRPLEFELFKRALEPPSAW